MFHPEVTRARNWALAEQDPGAPLRLNVLRTSEKATIAALRTASGLTANLNAEITLVAAEVVPWQFPLEKPPVTVSCLERELCKLICEAGIIGQEVRIQLCLCRDEHQGLRKALRPPALVVVGGCGHWWSRRGRNLKKFLFSLGHQVICAAADETGHADRATAGFQTIPFSVIVASRDLIQTRGGRR